MSSRQRYRLIDTPMLLKVLGFSNPELLKSAYDSWIREKLSRGTIEREAKWTESIAVGGERFVVEIKERLGVRAISRAVTPVEGDGSYVLRESEDSYEGIFRAKKELLSNRVQLRKRTFDL